MSLLRLYNKQFNINAENLHCLQNRSYGRVHPSQEFQRHTAAPTRQNTMAVTAAASRYTKPAVPPKDELKSAIDRAAALGGRRRHDIKYFHVCCL